MIRKIFHPGMNALFLSSTRRFIKILRAVLMHRPQGKQKSSTARLCSAYDTLIAGRPSDALGVLEATPHTLPHNT